MRWKDRSDSAARRGGWRGAAAVVAVAGVLTSGLAGTASASTPEGQSGVQAVSFWNGVAVNVIVVDAGKANAEAFLWYGFTQAAVYNAVNGITGRYELYRWNPDRPDHADPRAAAAAAAYTLLVHYFPASQSRLDAAYAEALGQIADGRAEDHGVRFGQRAAARIISLREDDGRGIDTPFTMAPEPGVWRPTPPALAPFFEPWLSQVKPLMLESTSQFRPGPPPELTSAQYTADFKEVKRLGELGSPHRTAAQTKTALFFSDIAVGAFQGALRDFATRHPTMGISKAARLFAAVDMSLADATVLVWDSKYHYGFWRPITAIELAETDGNPLTTAKTGWVPLITTPPYPDYTSGVNAVVGAGTRALARVLGTERIDLNVTSVAAGETRHYDRLGPINRDAIDARVWSGIHFRTADEVGNAQGQDVANWALDRYFQPVS